MFWGVYVFLQFVDFGASSCIYLFWEPVTVNRDVFRHQCRLVTDINLRTFVGIKNYFAKKILQ